MEAIKAAISASVTKRHGACQVELKVSDLCIKICVARHSEHIIYVRPDTDTRFECWYARREDVVLPKCAFCMSGTKQFRCACMSAEVHTWALQPLLELSRVVVGPSLAAVAIDYVDAAVARIEKYRAADSRKLRVMTFEEARLRPRPNSPPKVMPAPPFRWTERRR